VIDSWPSAPMLEAGVPKALAFRGQQPAQQRPGIGMVRRIQGDHVLVHGDFCAVLLDLCGDVVALGCTNGNGVNGPPTATHEEYR
jgi:hypothetical protein